MRLLPIVFLSLLSPLATHALLNGECHLEGSWGVCVHTASCNAKHGYHEKGHCPYDPKDVQCCVVGNCNGDGHSSCMYTTQCKEIGGKTVDNKCPGGVNFKCCIW